MHRLYLAGPDVFRTDSIAIGASKQARCRAYGCEGLFPLDASIDPSLSGRAQGIAIWEACVEMMSVADAAIVDLTPFRGVSADVGTAVEVGFLTARGIPCFAHTDSVDDYAARVAHAGVAERGSLVEDFGFSDNLMLDGSIWASGSGVVRRRAMSGFESCLRRASGLPPAVARHLDAVDDPTGADASRLAADYSDNARLIRPDGIRVGIADIGSYFETVPARLRGKRFEVVAARSTEGSAEISWQIVDKGVAVTSGTDTYAVEDDLIIEQTVVLGAGDF